MDNSLWLTFFAYQPEYSDQFLQKINLIAQEKGESLCSKDIGHLDLIHPGEHDGIDAFFRDHQIAAQSYVLEIGCGLGGTSRYINDLHKVKIDGFDYLENLASASATANKMLGLEG